MDPQPHQRPSHLNRTPRDRRPHGHRRGVLVAIALVVVTIVGVAWYRQATMTTADDIHFEASPAIQTGATRIAERTSLQAQSIMVDTDLRATAEEAMREADETSAEEARAAAIDSSTITVTGADRTKAASSLGRLMEAASAIEADGNTVAFEMVDLASGVCVSYDPDMSYYSASSIKGPYVIFLEQNVVGDDQGTMAEAFENTIEWSDNDAYTSLRQAYGDSGFAAWMADAGVTFEGSQAYNHYVHYSAHQLRLLWSACYPYLVSDEPGASWCRKAFLQTLSSPISSVLGTEYTTWSKAGWFESDEEYGSEAVTCVGGIVRSTTGDYAVAVMSDLPADFDPLEDVISELDEVHASLAATS